MSFWWGRSRGCRVSEVWRVLGSVPCCGLRGLEGGAKTLNPTGLCQCVFEKEVKEMVVLGF